MSSYPLHHQPRSTNANTRIHTSPCHFGVFTIICIVPVLGSDLIESTNFIYSHSLLMFAEIKAIRSHVTGCGGQRPKHRPLNPRERDPVPIVQETRWAPRPVWTHMYSKVTTGVRTSNRPPHSRSLFHARGHRIDLFLCIRSTCVYQWKNCINVTSVGIFLIYQCGARIDFSSRAWSCAHEYGHHIPYNLIMFS